MNNNVKGVITLRIADDYENHVGKVVFNASSATSNCQLGSLQRSTGKTSGGRLLPWLGLLAATLQASVERRSRYR